MTTEAVARLYNMTRGRGGPNSEEDVQALKQLIDGIVKDSQRYFVELAAKWMKKELGCSDEQIQHWRDAS